MVAMVLKETGNLGLLRDWILGLRDPFDRNNAGEAEADNPGQVLYRASLVCDPSHPVVSPALDALRGFERRGDGGVWIEGRSDFAARPVYQTKWAKWGLRALGLPDPYTVPRVYDPYSALFWWGFRSEHVAGPAFEAEAGRHYPYLAWAEDHFHGTARGPVGDRDYPLTWESRASQADYEAIRRPPAPANARNISAAPLRRYGELRPQRSRRGDHSRPGEPFLWARPAGPCSGVNSRYAASVPACSATLSAPSPSRIPLAHRP